MSWPVSRTRARSGSSTALLGALALSGCILADVDLAGRPCPCADAYVCDEASQTCVSSPGGGGATAAGTTATGSMPTTSTGASSTTSSGTGGQPPALAPPLVVSGDVAAGAVAFTVSGSFRLEATDTTHWQFERWFDLETSDAVNLAAERSRDMLLEPVEMEIGGDWFSAEDAGVGDVILTDETPARATLENTLAYPSSAGPFSVHNVYTVYASGRVGVRVEITNTSIVPQSFDTTEVSHTSVNESFVWDGATFESGNAARFQRTDGPSPHPTLLSMSFDTSGEPGKDFDQNYYWDTGGATLSPGDTFVKTGELQVGLGEKTLAELTDRAADAISPGLSIAEGADAVGSGYDSGSAAYVMSATSMPITFSVDASRTRHAPAFVIQGFTAIKWTVRKNGVVVVSSDMLDGPSALAHQDRSAERLVIDSIEEIPTSASEAERTFVIDTQ